MKRVRNGTETEENETKGSGAKTPGKPRKREKKQRRAVRKWTVDEDNRMRELVKIYGTQRWSIIGSLIPSRNGKQCRERWHNQLDPTIKKCAWTPVRLFLSFRESLPPLHYLLDRDSGI